MALIVADRVQETTNSTGTGAYTLGGAVPGFQTFASEVSNADTVYYSITDNVDFEVGLGTYASSGGTITRTTVFTSSNSNSAVNWGIGTKNIFLTYPADKAVVEDASNNVAIGNNLVVGGTVDGRDVAADGTKLDFVTVTQAVNLDQMETDIAALENGMVYKGDWNAGSGSFPGGGSAQTGWFYYVSGAGTVNGISFAVGDNIVATTDNASTSTYASNWSKHDQTDAVQAVVGLTGSIAKGSLLSALNVEDGADVTDTANVTSAGALMDSEVTNLAQVKAFNSSDYATAAQGTTADNALPKAGGTMSGAIDGNGNKMLFANMYSNLVDLPSATTYHGMFAHVHATGKAYFAHSGAWVPLANESTTLALAGGTMTGDVLYNDNVKAKFGAGSDLEIYHDGSNSYIHDNGVGSLKIRADQLRIESADGSETLAVFNQNSDVFLRHDNTTRLTTTSTGVQVTGNIANATGDFTLDVAGEIVLDADTNGVVRINDNGSNYGAFFKNGTTFTLKSELSDYDMVFSGNDGGSTITALTLDMSNGGRANFNNDIGLNDGRVLRLGDGDDTSIYNDGSHFNIVNTTTNQDIIFKGNDDGSNITALTLDMSAAGAATFNGAITSGGNITVGGTNNLIVNDSGVAIFGNDGDLSIGNSGVNGLISAPNGNLTLDVAGELNIDVDGGAINYKDGGTHFASLEKTGDSLRLEAKISDGDIQFRGNDGGGIITALTLDMSEAGAATFNGSVNIPGFIKHVGDDNTFFGFPAGDEFRLETGGAERMSVNGGGTTFNEDGEDLDFRVESNGQSSMLFVDGGNDRVGVGTSSPSTDFEVRKGVTSAIRVSGGSNTNYKTEIGYDNSTGPYIKAGSSGIQSLQFYVDNTSLALTLASNRNATFAQSVTATSFYGDGSNLTGIPDNNTTYSAGSGLDLSGTTFSIEADIREYSDQIVGNNANEYTRWVADRIEMVVQNAEKMRIESDGDCHVDGNVIAYSTTISDERLKKDIVKIDNALDKVSQLNGYTFEYLADGKKSAGVIAQEVEKVMPSAITESTLPLKMGEDDKTEYKTVQYDQLHGLMIEAIKELKAEIEELKAR